MEVVKTDFEPATDCGVAHDLSVSSSECSSGNDVSCRTGSENSFSLPKFSSMYSAYFCGG